MEKQKISKGTIVRTVMLAIVIINYALRKHGYDVINVSESEVITFVEDVISIVVVVSAWWKNNSFTDNAKRADVMLAQLNQLDREE